MKMPNEIFLKHDRLENGNSTFFVPKYIFPRSHWIRNCLAGRGSQLHFKECPSIRVLLSDKNCSLVILIHSRFRNVTRRCRGRTTCSRGPCFFSPSLQCTLIRRLQTNARKHDARTLADSPTRFGRKSTRLIRPPLPYTTRDCLQALRWRIGGAESGSSVTDSPAGLKSDPESSV